MPHLSTDLVVLCCEKPGIPEENARKIAEFTGAGVRVVALATAADIGSTRGLAEPCGALILSATTLVRWVDALGPQESWLSHLTELAPQIFLFGFDASDRHASILRALTSGGLLGLEPLPAGAAFAVADGDRESCGPFSGVTVQGVDCARDAAFKVGEGLGAQAVLIRAGDRPFLVSIRHGGARVSLAACQELADLDEKVPHDARLLSWFSRLVPFMIFLRSAFGDRLWHNDHPQACFIIDDPLLKRRHGYLEYSKLLEVMGRERFSASIAFIPWNYRRSQRKIARLISRSPASLSLCVHGCDHTRAEFADTNFASLCGKAQLALDRMNAHRRLFETPFDDVMVFPQGLFSRESLRALEALGYLAAVNTDLSPADTPKALALRNLLEVAVTAYGDMPLFGRRYPLDPAEFAFDLFLGKLALVVEHHGYFRNGYDPLSTFIQSLNRLDGRLEWNNLATVCARACLQRMASDGGVEVRFFTHRFQFTNGEPQRQSYLFFRPRTPAGPLPLVTVNGRLWPAEQTENRLVLRVSLDPGESADIRILHEDRRESPLFSWKPSGLYSSKVFVRRILCEIRDNHVDTSPVLRRLLSSARRLRARSQGRRPVD